MFYTITECYAKEIYKKGVIQKYSTKQLYKYEVLYKCSMQTFYKCYMK